MMQVHQLFVSPKSHFIAVRMTIYIYILEKRNHLGALKCCFAHFSAFHERTTWPGATFEWQF